MSIPEASGWTQVDHRGPVVRAEIHTTATAGQAWEAWADPDRLSEWFTDRATGRGRAGGTMTWIFERFGSRFPYQVKVAVAPAQLVLQGAPPGRPPYVLEIRIAPGGEQTLVEILNSGFFAGPENEDELEGVRSGWQMALAILKEYLERHFGRGKQAFFAMQPAPFEYEQILGYFLEAARLAEWLTLGGCVGPAGGLYRLALRDGSSMSGRVLAITSREAAMSWDEINGVVELKAFRLGPRIRAVAVRGCGWGLEEDRAQEIEGMLAGAIDRLVERLAARNEPH